MELHALTNDIRTHLSNACEELGISCDMLEFWDVSDYAIFVMMTESFYQSLNFRRIDPGAFLERRRSGNEAMPTYKDSRSYMRVLIDHFRQCGLSPHVLDVGGYIGRFSLETALLIQKENISLPKITCFEPGLTRNIIRANFEINGVSELVDLEPIAASDSDATADYKYAPGVLISGRICDFPSATAFRTVQTRRLDGIMASMGCTEAAIIKIDTEGHEPSVMAGLGDVVRTMPGVYLVEFWPDTLRAEVNGIGYADYIHENFEVLNIKSTLYPKFYTPIPDIRKFADDFVYEEGNIDLMFVNKAVPEREQLLAKLVALA